MFKHLVEQMKKVIGKTVRHTTADDMMTHSPAEIARLRKQVKRKGLPKMAGGKRVKYYDIAGVDPGLTAARVKEAAKRLK